MIGANKLTGDAGVEEAGQWEDRLRRPSLEGPCWARGGGLRRGVSCGRYAAGSAEPVIAALIVTEVVKHWDVTFVTGGVVKTLP